MRLLANVYFVFSCFIVYSEYDFKSFLPKIAQRDDLSQ